MKISKPIAYVILGLFLAPLLVVAAPIVSPSHLLSRAIDPTAGNGYQAQRGAVLTRTGTSEVYVKTTTAATGWARVDGGGASAVTGTGTAGRCTRWTAGQIVANGACSDDGTNVTFPGNVDVTGTLVVTGPIVTSASADINLGTSGPSIREGTGNPDTLLSANRGSIFLRTDGAGELYRNTDGAAAWSEVGGGGAVSPSVVITDTTAIGATNLSTVGTIDWYFPTPSLTFPTQTATDTIHSKLAGGWILDTFRWRPAGGTLYSAAPGPAFTSTASEDLLGVALSTSTIYGITAAFGDVQAEGFAYTFRVPATTTARVLRIHQRTSSCSNNTGARTLVVKLRDAGTSASLGPSSGSGSPKENIVYVITFNSSTADDELAVTFTMKNTGSFVGTCVVSISGMTLSPT